MLREMITSFVQKRHFTYTTTFCKSEVGNTSLPRTSFGTNLQSRGVIILHNHSSCHAFSSELMVKNIHYSDGFLQNLHPGGFREVGQILLINIRNTVSFICSLLTFG